jgi:preprotein translocase subunit YajC
MDLFFLMAPPPENQGGANLISTLIMFGSIILIFYFMIIRPQQKRAKEREKMLNELQKGDKVLTSGGIYGVIDSIEEKTVLIKVADNVKLKFDKQAINIVLEKEKK